ncbi:MAG: translation initiation factor IF-2 [Phycisphaerae bacterium]|nr:translation initiation factor IF-2 [Phycisphaerae bacterium]
MAKKTNTIRVHQIAKELGVTSKDVVSKCSSEGISQVTNHMSTLSAGLAATIREWFSNSGEAAGSSAVQTAAPVDLDKARARAKRRAPKKVAEPPAPKTETESVPPPPPPPAVPPPSIAPEPEIVVPSPETSVPEPQTPPSIAAEAPDAEGDSQGTDEPASDAPPASSAPESVAVPNAPERPKVVAPLGRKLEQPVKTTLAGPKVIRVEQPEPVRQPRPSRGPSHRSGGGGGMDQDMAPPMPGSPGDDRKPSRRNKRRSTARPEGRSGRGTLSPDQGRQGNWRQQDLLERERRLSRSGGFFKAARRDVQKRTDGGGGQRAKSIAETGGSVSISEPITIKELSAVSGIKGTRIIKTLLLAGDPETMERLTINSVLDADTAVETMLELGIELEIIEQKTAEEQIAEQFASRDMVDEQSRSPVVTILGHVDHGKTSLLDRIRNANVAEGEAGGITQATSAFQVPVDVSEGSRVITFIDTPGHEAFTAMRARGAKSTDIVVLVVAADDGVMPQTVESINHAKAAGVPIIVALNKIDKAEATDSNIQRILGQLAEQDMSPREWGGEIEVIRTSAIANEGIQDLLEMIDFVAQDLELTADFGGRSEGVVLEAQLQEGRGAVASILVQQGQLKKGDFIAIGRAYGRVRDMVDDHGRRVDSASPSMPLAISGMNEVPDAGDRFYVVKSIREAEAAAKERIEQERNKSLAREKVTLDNIFEKLQGADQKELPIIIKGDVQGSVETLQATLTKLSTDEIAVAVKHAAVGGINESDVGLAEASAAIIVGFNVTSSSGARRAAEKAGVDIRLYDVIYDISDDLKKAMVGMLDPEHRIDVIGHAEVRDVFKITKVGMVAGCYVTDGSIERNALIRVTRDDIVIESDRKLSQLKRFKDDAKEVRSGQECGMLIDGYDDIKVGDVLECYKTQEIAPTL